MNRISSNSSVPESSVDIQINALLMGGDSYSTGPDWWEDRTLFDRGLEMTGKSHPHVLIVPTARAVSEQASNTVVQGLSDYYNKRGAVVSALHPYLYTNSEQGALMLRGLAVDVDKIPAQSELEDKSEAADLIFVLGGDTNRMLNQVWRPFGIEKHLVKAIGRGAIASGTSAGTIAWFSGGHSAGSSLNRTKSESESFHYISALNLIKHTVACPHYEASPHGRSRTKSFDNMMYRRRDLGELGLGITSRTALEITANGLSRVVRGTGKGPAYIAAIHFREGKKNKKLITAGDNQFRLKDLTY